MSDTLNITYSQHAPNTRVITYSVGGTAPNLTTYSASMRIWAHGAPTTDAAVHTAVSGGAITLGAAGSITINMVTVANGLTAHSATNALWHYVLTVTAPGGQAEEVCTGYLIEVQP